MKIAMTGGGSGGHITPILAVAHEIKQHHPEAELYFIGQYGDSFIDMPRNDAAIDRVFAVRAGKLRRYANEGWRQLLDVRSQALNVRDIFRTIHGMCESYFLLRRLRPDALFTRGGYVSVPVALAAAMLHIPYLTHDSDSTPSLANRLIARWANLHAVAMPIELYPYPKPKTKMVGVPVSAHFIPVTHTLLEEYRHDTGLEGFDHVVLLTGGGNGARALNDAMIENTHYLLTAVPATAIVHIAGRAHEETVSNAYDALNLGELRKNVIVLGFVSDLYKYSGAADVIIARGGATNLAEFALQARACLIIPSPQLDWNVKNSAHLAARGAIEQLNEDQIEQPERLGRTLEDLLIDKARREAMGSKLAEMARPYATRDLAELVVQLTQRTPRGSQT